MTDIVDTFQVIQPRKLVAMSDNDLSENSRKLVEGYHQDISDKIHDKLLSLRTCLKSRIKKLHSKKQPTHLLLIEYSTLSASFPDVSTTLRLFLMILVTVASAKCSFSKLKIIYVVPWTKND